MDQLDSPPGRTSFKLFYSMPSIHNPTGISYSREKKTSDCKAGLCGAVFYIIEDDYLGELKPGRTTLYRYRPGTHPSHIKSFSQTTSAGISVWGLWWFRPISTTNSFMPKYSSDIKFVRSAAKIVAGIHQTGATIPNISRRYAMLYQNDAP